MKNMETINNSSELFKETLTAGLLEIYNRMDNITLTPEKLDEKLINEICNKLEELKDKAESVDEKAKARVLSRIESGFDCLRLTGWADNRAKFLEQAANDFDAVENFLLTLDHPISKSVLENIEEREKYL